MPRKRSFTSELLTQQQGEILKVGYLRKKGHVRRNWLDRWFVLTTEGIYYYKNRPVSSMEGGREGEGGGRGDCIIHTHTGVSPCVCRQGIHFHTHAHTQIES